MNCPECNTGMMFKGLNGPYEFYECEKCGGTMIWLPKGDKP